MPQTPGKRCHGCLALAMVLASQALTDTFLVAQKPQGQRLGISILIMVGDFCFLLVLRCKVPGFCDGRGISFDMSITTLSPQVPINKAPYL